MELLTKGCHVLNFDEGNEYFKEDECIEI